MSNNITLANTFILLGPEIGKKQKEIISIKKRLFEKKAIDETVFYIGDTPIQKIVFDIQSQNLFIEERLFIIKNAELIKKKDEADALSACIKEMDLKTVLIIISDETKLSAFFSVIENQIPKENKKTFYELFEKEKSSCIKNFLKQQGFEIDNDGIDTMLELVENNTYALERECTRLIQFFEDSPKSSLSKTITAVDVELWLSNSREETLFT
jgi:DNA polymerase-3 subunit delta